MKKWLPLLLISGVVRAQDVPVADSTNQLNEVVVSGFIPINTRNTSLNIEAFSLLKISEKAPLNLSDALAKLPGISQMTTGNSISKPVIRGMYGNRLLVLLSGLRFDNQQWQDEHGLGLSQLGIERVEVIKGPASLLYGSDAVGGVINIIEEKPLTDGYKADAGTQLYSNTLGFLADAGYSYRKNGRWGRLRLGLENHADYSDGSNKRVLNSRNKGYYLKAGFGKDGEKHIQEYSFNSSYNQYGFIMPDLATTFDADSRNSRSMEGPHHNVLLNMGNTSHTFILNSSLLKLNMGVQSNLRMEDEGGGQISLNMHLLSALEQLKWEKQINRRITFVANQQFTFGNNTNYGGRIIIPDATFIEENLSGYLKIKGKKLILEAGMGGNNKWIKTIATRHLTMPGDSMQPFSCNHQTANGMLGIVYTPLPQLTVKVNGATGYRLPNLAELSSNGLHEGVYRYEFGNKDLKPEQNLNTDISAEWNSNQLFVSASLFNNVFRDYVYLAPTPMVWFSFPVYKFRQQDAHLFGGEAVAIYHPAALPGWEIKEVFSYTRGLLGDSGNLPFIPAPRLATTLRYDGTINNGRTKIFAAPEFVYVAAQQNTALFETTTGSYTLFNLSAGLIMPASGWTFGLNINNITNAVYADHLSRLKYYGLYNQGINFVVTVRREIKW